ncbi:Uncharacterized protein SCF082_LOCUS6445 [Durusdinium trenchii]|uniref:Uncharacterized protein n=1 Tax=Durusdinium trenchii TaxID=1381693 RepID=A0ABP0IG86_9DINO
MDVGWTMPVPNVMGLLGWMTDLFRVQVWSDCDVNITCRLERFPKHWLAEPPPRFLPKLADIEAEEASSRLHYWGAILLLSPVLMALTCEVLRLGFAWAKGRGLYMLLDSEESDSECPSPRTSRTTDSKGSLLVHGDRRTTDINMEADALVMSGSCARISSTVGIISYHVICVSMVAVGLMNGWITTKRGGDFAWELWALWQQLCLWMLFTQNLIRCVLLDAYALQSSTFLTVLQFTMPLITEPCDTMKDWVITGICFLHAQGQTGFMIGAGIVALEVVALGAGFYPRWCRISDSLHISPPLLVLQVTFAVLIATQLNLSVIVPYMVVSLCCGDIDAWWAVSLIALVVVAFFLEFNETCIRFSEAVWLHLTDGGLLAVCSIYVILYSHIHTTMDDDCKRDLQKTYWPILELPLKPATLGSNETWCAWIKRHARNQCLYFLSSSRLLIAWAEDCPQGSIAVVLLMRYSGFHAFGLTGFSAIVSISKGISIPFFRRAILKQHQGAVQKKLDALVESNELKAVAAQVEEAADEVIRADRLPDVLQDVLSHPSMLVLQHFQVTEANIFQPIRALRTRWLEDVTHSEVAERVRLLLVGRYLQKGVNAQELLERGHMTGKCKDANFTATQCKEIGGFSAQECKAAGFTVCDCRSAGYPVRELKRIFSSALDWKTAGFNARDCREAGFSAIDCANAGFTAHERRWAGFLDIAYEEEPDRDAHFGNL